MSQEPMEKICLRCRGNFTSYEDDDTLCPNCKLTIKEQYHPSLKSSLQGKKGINNALKFTCAFIQGFIIAGIICAPFIIIALFILTIIG